MLPIDLLQTLVRIPSINPGQAKNPEWAGESRMVNFLNDYLKGLGASVTLDGPKVGRPNVIARFAPMDGRPRIMLAPHMDTVDVTGMTVPPFAAEIRGGKLWGRGASDTKGPMAAMLAALASRRDRLAKLPVAVDFVAFADEELYQSGSIDFAKKHAKHYQLALVGEPTSLDFVHASKGACHLTLKAKGKSAHASQPERGENAILALAAGLDAIAADFIPDLEKNYVDPVLGRTTLNIGTIEGGIQTNIVADRASATLDSRFTPACAAVGGPFTLLQSFLKSRAPKLKLELIMENPPMLTSPQDPLLKKIGESFPDSKMVGAPWFSDAAHLAAVGLPSVCIGPGSINQAHTEDEFIELSAFQDGVDFFTRLIDSLSN